MNKQATFTQLYRQYGPGIRKLCLGYTGDAAKADDLLQDTFLAVWNHLETFRGEAKWSTWIYRIAVNTCLVNLRKQKMQFVSDQDTVLGQLAEERSDTEQQVQLLYKSISQLRESDRVIIMLVLEDKPYPEIAEIIGITETNLRVKIHRIKKELTEIYQKHDRL